MHSILFFLGGGGVLIGRVRAGMGDVSPTKGATDDVWEAGRISGGIVSGCGGGGGQVLSRGSSHVVCLLI